MILTRLLEYSFYTIPSIDSSLCSLYYFLYNNTTYPLDFHEFWKIINYLNNDKSVQYYND